MLHPETNHPKTYLVKKLLPLAVLLMAWASGCNNQAPPEETPPPAPVSEKPAMVTAVDTTLPMCEIDDVESCEVESVHAEETVYRCDRCKDGAPCETCRKARKCETCGHTPCRCRHKVE